jgi:hypothetical protein
MSNDMLLRNRSTLKSIALKELEPALMRISHMGDTSLLGAVHRESTARLAS